MPEGGEIAEGPRLMEALCEPEFYVPYRKHSSGDLQSRLKTRKILGVGETDNGDVHRSKISQVLGHNEHLFVKFPRCYWLWHLCMAVVYTMVGLTNVFAPVGRVSELPETTAETAAFVELMTRFHGSILLGFSYLLWSFFGTTDKALARGLMMSIVFGQTIQLLALMKYAYENNEWQHRTTDLCIRLTIILGSCYFSWAIGSSKAGLRKTLSNKDLRERQPTPEDNATQPSTSSTSKKTE